MTKKVSKKASRSEPKVTRRRLVGLHIVGSSRNCAPYVYAIYEEDTLVQEGKTLFFKTRPCRGDSVQVVQHSAMMNGSNKTKEYHLQAFRPDLHYSIQAASVLYQQLEDACRRLDDAHKKGEIG